MRSERLKPAFDAAVQGDGGQGRVVVGEDAPDAERAVGGGDGQRGADIGAVDNQGVECGVGCVDDAGIHR